MEASGTFRHLQSIQQTETIVDIPAACSSKHYHWRSRGDKGGDLLAYKKIHAEMFELSRKWYTR